jgi:hypothetical protein
MKISFGYSRKLTIRRLKRALQEEVKKKNKTTLFEI